MKSEIDKYVIDKVKQKRKSLNISQRDLAVILNCSRGFIAQVESPASYTRYSIHQIYLIAKEFDCSPADFFPPIDSTDFDS